MRRIILPLLILLGLLCATPPVFASKEVQEKFGELAKRILDTTKNQPVSVGVFSQTGLPDSNAGPGLEGILADELSRAAPGSVKDDAKFEIKGDYSYAKTRDTALQGLKIIKIDVRIIEKEFSEVLLSIPLTLDFTQSVAELTQLTASIPPKGDKQERNHELERAQQAPSVVIHGDEHDLVSAIENSPYSVQILAGSAVGSTAPRMARLEAGQAYVDIAKGEIYEVRIHNRSPKPVAVSLSIDGLDVFHFTVPEHRGADGRPQYTHYIIHPAGHNEDSQSHDGTGTLVGWFQKLAPPDNYLSFQVTGYGEGAVSKAGIKARGQVGVIHVQFSECAPLKEGQRARTGNETGFGPPRSVQQKAVRFEIEPPHEFVTIRYTRPQS